MDGILATPGGGRRRRYKTGKVKRVKRKSSRVNRRTKKTGKTRRTRKMKGGNSLSSVLLPMGLLSLQQFFAKKARSKKAVVPKRFKKVLKIK